VQRSLERTTGGLNYSPSDHQREGLKML
jgi:hypothetical protein